MNETAYALYDSAEQLGLLFVLEPFGNNIRVKIPLTNSFCNQSIESLELSVRARNGLMRAGAYTIDKLIELIMSEEGLNKVRNLGRKSINEIKTLLLVKGYAELNDRERLTFWHDFLKDNRLPEKVTIGGKADA